MENESTTPQPVRGVVVPVWAIWALGAGFVIAIVVAAAGVVIGLRAQEAAASTERELNAQIANILNELDDNAMSIGMLEARSTQLERELNSIETRSTQIENAHKEVLDYLFVAHPHIRGASQLSDFLLRDYCRIRFSNSIDIVRCLDNDLSLLPDEELGQTIAGRFITGGFMPPMSPAERAANSCYDAYRDIADLRVPSPWTPLIPEIKDLMELDQCLARIFR